MKKKVCLFLLALIFLHGLIITANANDITGEVITGEATGDDVAIAIPILGPPPLLLTSPENETYLYNESILLNFTVVNEDYVLYNLDNTANTSISSSLYFNVSQGTHTVYLYANNSYGTNLETATFTANSSKLKIIYDEYNGSNKGNSTDFNTSTYEDLQSLSGVILENSEYGKITFNEAINVTADSDFSDKVIDLDSNTNISFNRIEVDSVNLPNFNKSATIILYGLSFTDPRVLRDGSVCSENICAENSYSGGNLSFNVTEFSVYSAEETPTGGSGGSPGGGGGSGGGGSSGSGGGAVTITKNSFDLSTSIISAKLKQGHTIRKTFSITNNENRQVHFELEISPSLENFLLIEEKSFSLQQGESKTIEIDIIAREDAIPDIYVGKVNVKTGNIEEEVFVSIEVESEDALLDVRAEILDKSQKISPGDEIISEMRVFNLGGEAKKDIFIEYIITDYEGNEISYETESLAIQTQVNFVKRIKLRENMKPGRYILYVKATTPEGSVASASDNFEISWGGIAFIDKVLIGILIFIIAILILKRYRVSVHKQKVHSFYTQKRAQKK